MAPLRAEAAHKSEMISQLLLAEAGLILEESKDFIKLQGVHDGYGRRLRASAVSWRLSITGRKYPPHMYTAGWINTIAINKVPAHVPMGIPVLGEVKCSS